MSNQSQLLSSKPRQSAGGRSVFIHLFLIMVGISLVITVTLSYLLYRTDFEQQRQHLLATVQSQAHLIQAIATQEAKITVAMQSEDPDSDAYHAAVAQIVAAHQHYEEAALLTEFTVASRSGENIVFLIQERHGNDELPPPIPFDSDLAEPQRRALRGESGTMIGLDYRREKVLAAYEPVPSLGLGIVAKVDVAQIQAPFIETALLGGLLALILISLGSVAFFNLSNPVIRDLEQNAEILNAEIVERLKAEAQISQSNLLLESSIESPKDMIILSLDLEYCYLYFNSAHVEAMKVSYGTEPRIGACIFDMMNIEEDINEAKKHYSQALSGEGHVATREYGAGRSRHYYETRYNPIYNAKNEIIGVTAFAQDITDRILAEEAMRDSEYLLRESQKAANIGSYILEITEGVWESSQTLDELFGIDKDYPKDIGGWLQLVSPEDQEMMQEHFAVDVLTSHKPFNKEYRVKQANSAKILWVHGLGQLELDTEGNPTKLIGVIQDITERKQADLAKMEFEKQILQTQKLESLGVLAGGIAHDFNNILMGILGYADLALSSLESMSPAREYVKGINESSHKAAELIKQMLAYSGKGKFSLEPIGLNQLIQDMTNMLNISIAKNVVLKFRPSKDPIYLEGDPSQIGQIIMNLVINASDAIGKKSGVVAVSTGSMYCDREYIDLTGFNSQISWKEELAEGMYIFVEVSDTGEGMSRDTIARIFEPFFTTKFTGRGLGLSAVLGIVRGHHGMVKIYSEPMRGTTFKVLFPLYEAIPSEQSDSKPTKSSEETWQGEGTFLIADDEEAVRSVGKYMLKKLGYEVLTADDGREAIEVFKAHIDEIVGVLLDLTMPHKDGTEVFREIKKLNPDVKVLLSSGYNEQDATQLFVGKGLAGFIQKPYVGADLLKIIKKIMTTA